MRLFIYLMTSQRFVWLAKSKCFKFFKWCNDCFTYIWFDQEEKLEPLRNITDDPRIRLLNRLYARKRKELKEREKLKVLTFT